MFYVVLTLFYFWAIRSYNRQVEIHTYILTYLLYAKSGRKPLFKCASQWQRLVNVGKNGKTAAAASHLPFLKYKHFSSSH